MSRFPNQSSSDSKVAEFIDQLCRPPFHRRLRRKLVCLAIILSVLMWPAPGLTLKPTLDPVSVLASTLNSTAGSISVNGGVCGPRASVGDLCLDSLRTDCDTGASATHLAVHRSCAADNYGRQN